MYKYFTAYKNSLSGFLQYRLNLFLLLISHAVSFSAMIFLWLAVYNSGQSVGTYTLENIILYYAILTIVLITIANGVGMGFEVSEQIQQGNMVHYLLKPYSYIFETLAKFFGESTINTVLLTPIVFVLALIAHQFILLPPIQNWILFFGSLVIGLIFYFLFYFLTALSSFWFERGRNFVYGMLVISLFLNGSILPLDLFPEKFQTLNTILPFQFLIFIPIQTLLGRIENSGQLIVVAIVWIGILSALTALVWKKGIRKFESVGK